MSGFQGGNSAGNFKFTPNFAQRPPNNISQGFPRNFPNPQTNNVQPNRFNPFPSNQSPPKFSPSFGPRQTSTFAPNFSSHNPLNSNQGQNLPNPNQSQHPNQLKMQFNFTGNKTNFNRNETNNQINFKPNFAKVLGSEEKHFSNERNNFRNDGQNFGNEKKKNYEKEANKFQNEEKNQGNRFQNKAFVNSDRRFDKEEKNFGFQRKINEKKFNQFENEDRNFPNQRKKVRNKEEDYENDEQNDEEPEKMNFNEERRPVNQGKNFRSDIKIFRSEGEALYKESPELNNREERFSKIKIPETKKYKSHESAEEIAKDDDLEKLESDFRAKALATFQKFSNKKSSNQSPSQIPYKKAPLRSNFEKSFEGSGLSQGKSEKSVMKIEKTLENVPSISKKTDNSSLSMCSLEECRSRQESHQLSIFEISPGSEFEVNPKWAIKKYLRSSADREEDKRSSEALTQTLHYLIDQIIDVDSNGNPNNYNFARDHDHHSFKDIYPFVFDRMRAIVKDWKMLKNNESEESINDHEIIARFLILSCVEGYEYEDFNLNLNLKLTEDVLNCLVKAYESRREKKLKNPNESEFIAYFIITKPDNMLHITTLLKSLSKEIICTPVLQTAIRIFQAFHSEDFCEFFNIVKTSNYLTTCAAYPLFHKVRNFTIDKMFKTTTKNVMLCDFVEMLWFSDFEEATSFVAEIGLSVEMNFDNERLSIVKIGDVSEKLNFQFHCCPVNIQEKKGKKFRKEICEESIWENSEEKGENEEKIELKIAKNDGKINSESGNKSETNFEILKNKETAQKIFESFENDKKSREKGSFSAVFSDKLQEKSNSVVMSDSESKLKSFLAQVDARITEKSFLLHILQSIIDENFSKIVSQIEPEKKISFRFPEDDKTIFSIIKDPNEKEKLKQSVRKFRIEKKSEKKIKEKKMVLIKQMIIFNQWKKYFTWKKLKKYVNERKIYESQAFVSQFSNEILSDVLSNKRLLGMKRPRFEEKSPPELNSDALIGLLQEKNISVYKILIFSPNNHELFTYTQKQISNFQEKLQNNGIFIKFTNECSLGCDLVVFIGKLSEIHRLKLDCCQRLLCIIEDCDVNQFQIKAKLNFLVSDKVKLIILPKYFEVSEFSYYDLIGYQLCKSITKYKSPYHSLTYTNFQSIFTIYEQFFEKLDLSTKSFLFSDDFQNINTWPQSINKLTSSLISNFHKFYYNPPSLELLQKHDIEKNQYLSVKKNYLEAENFLQRLLFKNFPIFKPEELRTRDLLAILYQYAASITKYFEKKFQGCAFELLSALDELFNTNPVVINQKLKYIKGPWCQYFLTILSVILDSLEKLEINVIWDQNLEIDNSDQKPQLFEVNLQEIQKIQCEFFNEKISEEIFISELNKRY